MEFHTVKKPVISLFKGMSVLVLAVAVILGWFILFLAAVSTLGDYVSALGGVMGAGEPIVLWIFFLILLNPWGDLVVLLIGGYIIQRLGWADWL